MGVFASKRIEKRMMFGPFKGQKIPVKDVTIRDDHSHMYMWDVSEGGKFSHIVDGRDEQHSNWMRFVNCARDDKEQNLVAMQFRGEIYYKACVPVEAGSELLVWYQESCSETMDSSSRKDQTGRDYVCDACGLMFAGPIFLLRHKSVRCPGNSITSDWADDLDSVNEGTSVDKDSSMPSATESESSYVVVHIGCTDETSTVVEAEEDSPYVVVHVQPVPSTDEVGNVKRGRRTLIDTAKATSGKKTKVASRRRRSTDSVRKAKKVVSKARVTKARSSSSKARNTTAKKLPPAKRPAAGVKRKTSSTASGFKPSKPRLGTVEKIKRKKRTEQTKSAASSKPSLSRSRKVVSRGNKRKSKASEEEQSTGKTTSKVRKAAKTQEAKNLSNKSNSASSRKRRNEGKKGKEGEDESVKKRPRKKPSRKTKTTGVTESKRDSSKHKKTNVVPKGKPVITCEICSRNFRWKSQLSYHMRSHTQVKEFTCRFCNKGLSQLSSLRRHLRGHMGDKPHECQECGKRFAERSKLLLHQRKHTGEPPEKKYKCTVCDRRFTLSANMKTHMRIHTGEKPYPCPQCGKCFRRSSDVAGHMRSHTGERPYKCSHCDKAFTMISHRNRHEVIHSGQRPFKCDVCGKGFTQPNSVKAHLKVHARKEAQLGGAQEGARKRRKEIAPKDAAMQTGEQTVESGPQQGVAQNDGAERLQRTTSKTVGNLEEASAETLHIGRTEEVQAENAQLGSMHADDSAISGIPIPRRDGSELLQLDSTQIMQTGSLDLDNAEVRGVASQDISLQDGTELTTIAAGQLQLNCTNEQFDLVSSQINGKELLPLPCAGQGSIATGPLQLELTQNNGQDHGTQQEEPTLLAL